MNRFLNLFLVSILSGILTLSAYKVLFDSGGYFSKHEATTTIAPNYYASRVGLAPETIDFTEAAEKTIHTVVHVKNISSMTISNPILDFFYGYGGSERKEQVGTGSGVIISEDGYIVTNSHVIKGATEIEITLNNRKSYPAKIIGTDSKTDIALLKIDAKEILSYSVFANSNSTKVGEWVLAVGNPYNLTSTVTAGIISAKARNLDTGGIQSFIQTDAAVNPGNSGGALVNTQGELIGVNTMITSVTGSYVGYSFAVPSNIVRKIIEDIMEFGQVQRGILGVEGSELNSKSAKELGVEQTQGFYIKKVTKNSGSEKAGLKKGDIIVKLEDQDISTFADLSGYMSTKRPNDKVNVTIIREGKSQVIPVFLSKNEFFIAEYKGLEIENIDSADKKRFNLTYGVRVKSILNESLKPYEGELLGCIILKIDNVKATDVETVSKILKSKDENQSIRIEMMNRGGEIFRIII